MAQETRQVLAARWAELPAAVRTPAQVLGRHAVGCEGTHGIFPRCNLTCTPCYHSEDANKVRVDGAHTLTEVRRQMSYLRRVRGPRAHAQLIGGEVSLLDPDTHDRGRFPLVPGRHRDRHRPGHRRLRRRGRVRHAAHQLAVPHRGRRSGSTHTGRRLVRPERTATTEAH